MPTPTLTAYHGSKLLLRSLLRRRLISQIRAKRAEAIGSATATAIKSSHALNCRRQSMWGATPAWRRHCARLRSRKASSSAATAAPKESYSSTAAVADQVKSFSIGSLAGLLGSLAGMGGGFVMIPMMTAVRQSAFLRGGLGLHQHQAHGTSLFAVGTTGLAGAFGYGISVSGFEDEASADADGPITDLKQSTGLVELDTAAALAATAMVTARLGAVASTKLSERALKRALGYFMLFIAPLVPGKAYLEAWYDVNNPTDKDAQKHIDDDFALHTQHGNLSQLERLLPASLIGVFSGFLSGMFGVGGGAIVVPSLVLSTDMSHHAALGTSLFAMVLPSMVGTFTHHKKGNVNWRVAPMLALGSAVGAYFGGKEVSLNLDESVLRAGFSCLMLVLGVKTIKASR